MRRDDQQTARVRLNERRVVLAEAEPQADIWNRRSREVAERRISPLHSRLVLNDLERDVKRSGKKNWWQKFHAEDAAVAAAESPAPADHPEIPGTSPEAVSPAPGPRTPDPKSAPKSSQIKPNPTKSNPRTKKSTPAPGARLSQPQHVAVPATPDHEPPSTRRSAPLSSIPVNGVAGRGAEALDKIVPPPSQVPTTWDPRAQSPKPAFIHPLPLHQPLHSQSCLPGPPPSQS